MTVILENSPVPMSSLRAAAEDYARHGLSTVVAFPRSKVPAIRWRQFAHQPPTPLQLDAQFSYDRNLNIGVVCGEASRNVTILDAESKRVFIDQVNRFDQAGCGNTWMAQTFRGGHIYFRLPFPVAGYKSDGFEIRGQGQFVLLPPSLHPEGTQYAFLHRPDKIYEALPSELPWLTFEPAGNLKPIPRTALRLLNHESLNRYPTRSEVEQSIVTILWNAGFTFEETLKLFRTHKAAGKFSELYSASPQRAVAWLRTNYDAAATYCVSDSPVRKVARALMAEAQARPWPGRHGSIDKAVYMVHLAFAHQSGQPTYHASTRDLAEYAGCTPITASRASRRLRNTGVIELTKRSAFCYANRYVLLGKGKDCTTPSHGLYKTVSIFPFSLPDCFRRNGLGRVAYEVLEAIKAESLTVFEIKEKTGRSTKTIRKALGRMRELGFVWKSGRKWSGREVSQLEMDEAARKLGTFGAAVRQKHKHLAERLRHELQKRMREFE